MKESLRKVVETTETRAGFCFDLSVNALIFVSILSLTLETWPGLSERTLQLLSWLEVAITVLFTAEFAVRCWLAEPTRKYTTGFWGIVDFLAIAPFYLELLLGSLGFDLRAIRGLRLLRLVRLFKVGRYNAAMKRFSRAFQIAREEIILYLFLSAILIYISAALMYFFEHEAQPEHFESIVHSLWWAVATLTTVGYGDVFPVTPGGKVVATVLIMLGIGILAGPSGIMASALHKARQDIDNEQ